MIKKSHLRLASAAFDTIFTYRPISRLLFLFGSIEPDINVFTYILGHGEERVRAYIDETLEELSQKRFWSPLDFYKAGRASHYIVDSFTYPHTKEYKESMKDHIAWEHKIQRALEKSDLIMINLSAGSDIDSLKESYLKEDVTVERDIVFASTAICILLERAYAKALRRPLLGTI